MVNRMNTVICNNKGKKCSILGLFKNTKLVDYKKMFSQELKRQLQKMKITVLLW